MDIVNKAGAWFSYNGQRIGQGRENVKQFLKDNPEIMQDIETKVRDKYSQMINANAVPENTANNEIEAGADEE